MLCGHVVFFSLRIVQRLSGLRFIYVHTSEALGVESSEERDVLCMMVTEVHIVPETLTLEWHSACAPCFMSIRDFLWSRYSLQSFHSEL